MEDSTEATTTTETAETDAKDWKAEAEKWQALARKNEERAKGNAGAVRELERLKAATMTETEKAVAEAEQRGRSAALAAAGPRLVRAEFRTTAAGRVDRDALDAYLEDVDLAKFVGADGEPDAKAIEARVAKLAGPAKATSFDGGARQTAAAPSDMNMLIRRQAGLG